MTSCAAPAAHAGCTRRRPGRRDSAGALPVRWSVRYLDRPRMPAAGLRRPPSRSARTTWPLWGSSLRAPSVAGDLPPPHRRTGFPQPPATLLPPNRARQACGPAARPARRSAAPRQQQQPGLRAAASSSAEHGQISHRIFVHRPGHTVPPFLAHRLLKCRCLWCQVACWQWPWPRHARHAARISPHHHTARYHVGGQAALEKAVQQHVCGRNVADSCRGCARHRGVLG